MRRWIGIIAALLVAVAIRAAAPESFHFAIVGDRTGEAQLGKWESVWSAVAADRPAFVISVGDVIQGMDDATAEAQWQRVFQTLTSYRRIPFYLTPGNHDVWSRKSEELFRKHSGRDLHYSFDYGPAHFVVLDNSRWDALPAGEMAFLQSDLDAHRNAAVKFVVMHRPSWLADAALRNTAGGLHQIAKRYGVRYWIAGHVHQLIHAEVEGITYYSVPSAGGHLRLSGKYEDGWFFGWTRVDVHDGEAAFAIHDLQGRTTSLKEWGLSGLATR
jgi:3',5'-cyclic-AMP phosphodiesterase